MAFEVACLLTASFGGMTVNRLARYTLGLILLAIASPCTAKEFTLEEAVQAWSFMEGNWTLTSPEGKTFDVQVRLAPTKTAYISESQQGLHVFGWDPKTKLLEIQSYLADSTRGTALYDRKSETELVSTTTKLVSADGNETTLTDKGVFTVVDKNTWTFAIGDVHWTITRKPKK